MLSDQAIEDKAQLDIERAISRFRLFHYRLAQMREHVVGCIGCFNGILCERAKPMKISFEEIKKRIEDV